jgi:hypothetical protein
MQPPLPLCAVYMLIFLINSSNASPREAYVIPQELDELASLMPISPLPTPDGLDLKYVVLGIGTQNYTCTGVDEDSIPASIGAVGKSAPNKRLSAAMQRNASCNK